MKSSPIRTEPLFLSLEPDLFKTPAQTPQGSRTKNSLDQILPDKSGCKIEQEPIRSIRKTPINTFDHALEIRQPTLRTRYYDYITMGRFQIDSTITRARICLLVLFSCLKILSILTAAGFWIAAPLYLISLVDWQIPWKFIYFTDRYIRGLPLTDHVWRFLFPNGGSSYHLRVEIHTSLYSHSPAIFSTILPILIDNPVFLFFLMTFMFISHHLLCFAHDCLTKFTSTIRATGHP